MISKFFVRTTIYLAINKMKNLRYAIALTMLLIWSTTSAAPGIKAIEERKDIPRTRVNSLFQDEFGMIWVGTKDGLLRYDGNNSITFRHKADDTTSLFSNNVKQVTGDHNGHLYIISNSSLSCYDIRTEQFHILAYKGIKDITCSKENIFAATGNEILSVSGDSLLTYYRLPSDDMGRIICIKEDDRSRLLIGTDENLYSLDNNKKVTTLLNGVHIQGLYVDTMKNIWAGTRNSGITCIRPDGMTSEIMISSLPELLTSNYVCDITEDIYGRIWIGTLDGIFLYDREKNCLEDLEYDMSAYCFLVDSRDDIWIGSDVGVSFYNPQNDIFTSYSSLYDIRHNISVSSVAEIAGQGKVFFGTQKEGLFYLDKKTGKIQRFIPSKGTISSKNIQFLLYDDNSHTLWISTHLGGLDKLDVDTGEVTVFLKDTSNPSSIPNNNVDKVFIVGDSLLIASSSGVSMMDSHTGQCRPLSNNKQLYGKYASNILLDDKKRCWISTYDGILCHHLDGGIEQELFFDLKGALGTNRVTNSFQDSNGTIWFGTSGSGLFKYNENTGTFSVIDTENSNLPNNYIRGISESGSGYLLIASNNGFSKYDTDTGIFYNFESGKGFPVTEIMGNSICETSSGEVFVAGRESMVSFQESRLINPSPPDSIWLSGLYINGQKVPVGGTDGILERSLLYKSRLDLTSSNSVLEFDTHVPEYAFRYPMEYRIKELGDEWIGSITGNRITYSNLPPGHYHLEVRCNDPRTGEANASKVLNINVHPKWYQTLVFKLFMLLLTFAVFYTIARIYFVRANLAASLEEERREKERIKELNQSKLNFFTHISHEIRTPVTIINSQIEDLLQKGITPPSTFSKISSIHGNLSRINTLLDELLDFRKQESGNLEIHASEHNLASLLNHIYLVFKEYSKTCGIEFVFNNSCGNDLMVWYDSSQLDKALYNLLYNAFKNTGKGGRITLSLHEDEKEVTIDVSDTGCGIPEKYLQSVFTPFFQVPGKDHNSGTGLGLSITKGIIDGHGGSICCDSIVGTGSTFTIKLPKGCGHIQEMGIGAELEEGDLSLYDFEDIQDRDDNPGIINIDGKKPIILIVEDNRELLNRMADLFEPIYNVLTADNGISALKMMKQQTPDIILSDLMMPNMDGNELCTRVKTNLDTCHIPFLILTAKVAQESILDSLRNGADDYITKPFNSKILISKCNNLVNSRILLQQKFSKSTSNASEAVATNEIDRAFINKAIDVVKSHITDSDFDVEKFAEEMALGRTRLFSKLKGVTGQTPNHFILTVRMKYAVGLFTNNPDISTSEVSYMSGFSSPSYFIRLFKNTYGKTPSEFRASLKDQNID